MAKNFTRKNRKGQKKSVVHPGKTFPKEISLIFLETLLMVKLFHWKTTSYAAHKATDDFYTKLNANMDSFIEILLGKMHARINMENQKSIRLIDCPTLESFVQKLESFKYYLLSLDDNDYMKGSSSSDLYNIRDTIWGDVNQLLYLLTFK